MKPYIHFRKDIADTAAIAAFVTANPTHFSVGSLIVAANGNMSLVKSKGVVGAVTVA